ncbi:MAG: thermonuclease family protein [Patescibacteria group bacterium]
MNKRRMTFVSTLCFTALFGVWLILTGQGTHPAAAVAEAPIDSCSADGVCVPRATSTNGQPLARPTSTIPTNATVVRVVDGDTFVAMLDGERGEFKVRMLGINTPETVDPRKPVQCFGKEASNRLKSLLPAGVRISLKEDPQADEQDKYQRLLRNVLLSDGTDVNASMVRDGYAEAYLSFPLNRDRKQELKKLQEIARASQSGLWSPASCPQS